MQGYTEALAAAGVRYDDLWVREGDFSRESGYAAMESLLGIEERPSAVFVGSDALAIGALAAVRDAGLRVPEEMAVVGFDDVPLAADAAPPLTTVHLPAQRLGESTAQILVQLMAGEQVSRRAILLETHLVIRRSA